MFFLILFLPFLGFLGGCLFGRFIGKGIIPYTVLNIFLPCIFSTIVLIITILGCFCSLYFSIINTSFFYFLKKWYTDRFLNETFSLFFLQISKNYMYTRLKRRLLETYNKL